VFSSPRDQAFGLRRMFAGRDVRVLPLARIDGGDAHTSFVVNLAAALTRIGQRSIVLDADRGLVAPTMGLKARFDLLHLLTGEREFHDVAMPTHAGFWVMPAARGLAALVKQVGHGKTLFTGFGRLREPFDTVLLCAGPEMIAPLVAGQDREATLICGAGPRHLAATYSGIKALHNRHGFTQFRVVYHRAASSSSAAACHERLAGTVDRFLRANISFGGAIEDEGVMTVAERARSTVFSVAAASDAARAFERIATASLEWPLPKFSNADLLMH
jgi:flagellar biosynthesis protein FlhG